jgi:hypothetical protein
VLRGAVAAIKLQSLFSDTLTFAQWGAVFGLIVGAAGGALALEGSAGPVTPGPVRVAPGGSSWARRS